MPDTSIDSQPDPVIITDRDLLAFGKRYALDYRFPDSRGVGNILCGQVQEYSFRPGMRVVYSDVEVLESYASSSLDPSPLFIIVMLEGRISLKLGDERLELSDRMALTLHMEREVKLDVSQPAGQQLKVLTLSLDEQAMDALQLSVRKGNGWYAWRLPPHIYQGLLHYRHGMCSPHLHLEGLGLQVLAQGMERPEAAASAAAVRVPHQDLWRLERVRECIAARPEAEYSLTELARLAAMSPSSLRSKFKACYGQTLFEFCKERRLEMAREYLLKGFSVQQAAHFSGYSYATNFTTAFRKRFGIAPSALIR